MTDQFNTIIAQIVDLLVTGDYQQIFKITNGIRVRPEDIAKVIREYGKNLIPLPENAFTELDIIKMKGKDNQFSIRMPLWTMEEGRSDLTLEMTGKIINHKIQIEVDDIRVL